MARVLGFGGAILLHLAVILFGGWFFMSDKEHAAAAQQVELVAPDAPAAKEKDKPKDVPPPEDAADLKADADQPPDSAEMLRQLDTPELAPAPALDAASLSAMEAALGGGAPGASDFGQSVNFASGGRIGGTGRPGSLEGSTEGALGMAEIDQRPRPVFQATPQYPAELRGRKVEGSVTVAFLVDAEGRVTNQRVEKSSNPAFDKPALDAVRKWTFEPAVRGGKRVSCKMRQSIKFQPNQQS